MQVKHSHDMKVSTGYTLWGYPGISTCADHFVAVKHMTRVMEISCSDLARIAHSIGVIDAGLRRKVVDSMVDTEYIRHILGHAIIFFIAKAPDRRVSSDLVKRVSKSFDGEGIVRTKAEDPYKSKYATALFIGLTKTPYDELLRDTVRLEVLSWFVDQYTASSKEGRARLYSVFNAGLVGTPCVEESISQCFTKVVVSMIETPHDVSPLHQVLGRMNVEQLFNAAKQIGLLEQAYMVGMQYVVRSSMLEECIFRWLTGSKREAQDAQQQIRTCVAHYCANASTP